MRDDKTPAGARHRYSLVACVRWEETDIAEWVQYHKNLGFSHIYIYSNDADPIPTFKAILPYIYGHDPFVTFKHFPKLVNTPQQHLIYYHFLQHYKHETEWFSFIDADEFYVLKGVDDIDAFMAPYRNHYDAVYFNWVIYGHAGKEVRDNDSILLSHTRRSRTIDAHTKMMTRSAFIDVDRLRGQYNHDRPGFWHFWDIYDLGRARLVNVLHDAMDGYAKSFPQNARAYVTAAQVSERIIAKAYLAHFQFKSEADFKRRVERGGSLTVPYWRDKLDSGAYKEFLKRGNDVEDAYLAQFWLRTARGAYDIALPDPLAQGEVRNVGLRKPSEQSSIRQRLPDDPAGCHMHGHANNGIRTGGFGFCTQREIHPWWKVNLLAEFILTELRIFGQGSSPLWHPGESRLLFEASLDGATWTALARNPTIVADKESGLSVVSVPLEKPSVARFLRVSLIAEDALHFDEIEIYGRPA